MQLSAEDYAVRNGGFYASADPAHAARSGAEVFEGRWDAACRRVLGVGFDEVLTYPLTVSQLVRAVEDGLLPFKPPGRSAAPLEEERRLFYVAATRTKELLYLLSRQVDDRPGQRRGRQYRTCSHCIVSRSSAFSGQRAMGEQQQQRHPC